MPSPAKKKPYAIIREDNTFVVYDLSKLDYQYLTECLFEDKKYCGLEIGIISLKDIRAIVLQKETPKEEKEKPLESGNPGMDAVTLHWLKQQEEMAKILKDDEEQELEGGRFS
jgi:hypothetical protein